MITLHTPQGIVVIDPATVTDAQLAALGLTRAWADREAYFEQRAKEQNDMHVEAKLAFDNWPSLTLVQKDKLLKGLLSWYLAEHRYLFL